MTSGIKTVIYPVTDLAQAKELYGTILGVEPDMDETYYVGFSVGGQHIGLDPNGHKNGMTGPVGYCHANTTHQSTRGSWQWAPSSPRRSRMSVATGWSHR